MFCHIVPSTYLKSWKIKETKNSIYIFERDKINLEGDRRNILNLNRTKFGKVNFYYLKMDTCNSKIYDELFAPIIKTLDVNYIFEYKGNYITKDNPGLFRIIYLTKRESLIIKRKNTFDKINIKSLEFEINKLWGNSQKLYIENFFNNEVENKWNNFLNIIRNINDNFELNIEIKKYIMLFITLQIFKDGSTIDLYLKQILPNFKSSNYDQYNIQNEILIDNIYGFIYDIKNKTKNSSNIIYNTFLNLLNSYWTFSFYFNNNDDFLTSDNPIFVETFNNKECIIFPLTPSICLLLTRNKKDLIAIIDIKDYDKKNINTLIIKNSKEHIAYYASKINKDIYNS